MGVCCTFYVFSFTMFVKSILDKCIILVFALILYYLCKQIEKNVVYHHVLNVDRENYDAY